MKFIWLNKGGKYSSFDQHRQFLPIDHPFQHDIKNFRKGVIVTDPQPQMFTGAEVYDQIEALVPEERVDRFEGLIIAIMSCLYAAPLQTRGWN